MTGYGTASPQIFSDGPYDIDPFVPAQPAQPPEANPMQALVRAMRGRWKPVALGAATIGPVLGTLGFLSGTQLYESQAIVRVYPQEANVLYRTGDDSVLKTFDSYVKAETTYIASPPIMARATQMLRTAYPEQVGAMTINDLSSSIDIKRADSLITLTTKSKSAAFAAEKLQAVADAYLALHAETEASSSAVRLAELQAREKQLVARQTANQASMLEVGGEYGADSLVKAHADKVAKIDEIASRKDEVEGTLAALKAKSGQSTADLVNQEILRSTLLDRALADLNFERARLEAELSTLQSRYPENSPQVQDKKRELAVISQSMVDRREQIKVLGQTTALTDTTAGNEVHSQAEIQAVLEKVTQQLADARAEARDLNGRIIALDSLRTEADNIAKLLEETRQGIEVITVEAGKALPGYSVLMSPPLVPVKPAQDNTKVRTAIGLGAGVILSLATGLIWGLVSNRVRYSDTLARYAHLAPVKLVSPRARREKVHADRLRNALQLHALRVAPQPDKTRVIAITRLDAQAPDELALALAISFAEARSRTLLIDADARDGSLTKRLGLQEAKGWREALADQDCTPYPYHPTPGLEILPVGHETGIADTEIGIGAIQSALSGLKTRYDLVILLCGSLADSVSTELVLSVSDLAVAEVRPSDRKPSVAAHVSKLDLLPRQGGILTFAMAKPGDPGL